MKASDIINNLCVNEITFVNTYTAKSTDYPMRNKGRYRAGLLFTHKGTEVYTFRDGEFRAEPGTVLVIPKNESYRIDLQDPESVVTAVDFETAEGFFLKGFF